MRVPVVTRGHQWSGASFTEHGAEKRRVVVVSLSCSTKRFGEAKQLRQTRSPKQGLPYALVLAFLLSQPNYLMGLASLGWLLRNPCASDCSHNFREVHRSETSYIWSRYRRPKDVAWIPLSQNHQSNQPAYQVHPNRLYYIVIIVISCMRQRTQKHQQIKQFLRFPP